MKYLLDTNICIYFIKSSSEAVKKHFGRKRPGDIFISTITVAELQYGVEKSQRRNENLIALEQFLQPLVVIGFSKEDARHYGNIRADLERRGTPIGSFDMLIAAQAMSGGYVLVTNNEKEFKKINGLVIENWTK